MKILHAGSLRLASLTFALLLVLGAPLATRADVRPLSRSMLSSFQATNSIGDALSIEDYAAVEAAARELESNARELRTWDSSRLGFKPANRAEFDGYLKLQEEISGTLMKAAGRKDAAAVVAGLDEMLGKSCLGCHKNFRERQGLLKASTMFMAGFVNTWKEINRGLLLNDFTLVARAARTLETAGQVMSWDPVLQASFYLSNQVQRNKFRGHLHKMISAAGRVEDAATRGESEAVRKALVEMWVTGCLACHQEFR